MPTAAELLAMRSTGDKTLVIDNDLRTIKIPSTITNIGVESDDDVLRLNFRMPRYLGKTDLSTFTIRINYLNAKGEGDVYSVSDMEVVGDNIAFSWLVGPNATKYKGTTTFNVCMKIVDGEGYIQKEYNTTVASLPVLEGLETEEGLVEYYSDILEQWKRELFGIGDTEEASIHAKSEEEQQKIVDKGVEVLDSIPKTYQTTYEMANNAYRTRANAIVSTVQGEPIILDDSSSDPIRGLRIFGKTTQVATTGAQLFDCRKLTTVSGQGITMSNDGTGVITFNGTATSAFSSYNIIMDMLPPGTYYVSGNIENKAFFYIRVTRADGTFNYVRASNSFTLDGTETELLGYIYGPSSGVSFNGERLYPMLNAGDTPLPWEPYSGGVASPSSEWPQNLTSVENPTVNVCGKNLIPFPYAFNSPKTAGGVTFTATPDGGISVTGIPTEYTGVQLFNRLVWNSDLAIALLGTYTNLVMDVNVYDVDGNPLAGYVSAKQVIIHKADFPKDFGVSISVKRNVTGTEVTGTAYPIVVSGTAIPTVYEKYIAPQTIDKEITLRGMEVSAGQYICDEIDFERGIHIQRIGVHVVSDRIVTTRFENYDGDGYYGWYYTHDDFRLGDGIHGNYIISDRFMPAKTSTPSATNLIRAWHSVGNAYFTIASDSQEDADAAIRGATIYYVLATPIETELTAEELVKFGETHTNYLNTTILNNSGAWMEVKYNEDLKMYTDDIVVNAAETIITQDKIQTAVDAWLNAHYSAAEGVSF